MMAGTAINGISDMQTFVNELNVTGLMFDYEPSTNINHAHAELYSYFLIDVKQAMDEIGAETGMCISDWGILDLYENFYTCKFTYLHVNGRYVLRKP
eukprot:UN23088